LDLLKRMGAHPAASAHLEFLLPRNATIESRVEAWIQATHLGCGFVVLRLPSDTKQAQRLARRYGKLARQFGERRRLTTIISAAGDVPPEMIQKAVDSSGGHALTAPAFGLAESVAVIRRACLLLATDPGWVHLAASVGTPSVGLDPCRAAHENLPFAVPPTWLPSGIDDATRRTSIDTSVIEMPPDILAAACLERLDAAA
jgi:ADP-heptose:LPS heptosyltransferase